MRSPFVPGQRIQNVRHQADSIGERHSGNSVHQSEVGRQSGTEAAAEVPVAAEPAPGVRPDAGRAADGPRAVQEGAQSAGVGVRRRRYRGLGSQRHRPDRHFARSGRRCFATGNGERSGQGARLGWGTFLHSYYTFLSIFPRFLNRTN